MADDSLEALLDYIKRARNFDFTGYKRSTLSRRVGRRTQIVGCDSYAHYLDYLASHPAEFNELFNTILINVTTFFRDTTSWDYVRSDVVPRIIREKSDSDPIRVWSAGCASGAEPYTLAMVLAEELGPEAFQARVKIYATDVDEVALQEARHGIYSRRELKDVPPDLLQKYFDPVGDRYQIQRDLRRSVIYGRNDLVQDAPISRIDLLVCRNTLMYFTSETQARILARFHFALNEGGFLFLGKAETLLSHSNAFAPVDLRRRVFQAVRSRQPRVRSLLPASVDSLSQSSALAAHVRIREGAFDASSVAQFVVDTQGRLALVNRRARELFGLTPDDVGRPLQDLSVSYRPAELRTAIDRASTDRRSVTLQEVEWAAVPGESMYLDVTISPLTDHSGNSLGVTVMFLDVTAARQLQTELEHSNQELETAYEELQSTNEELETTNEELQSTVEELETTNEELQSANEELETMNEELQSTNEELQTINDEVRLRGDEVSSTNLFLESILRGIRPGVVVVDTEFRVKVWSAVCEDLWGLRPGEVEDENLFSLDIGLPLSPMRAPIKACLAGTSQFQELSLSAVNRRGRPVECEIRITPMVDANVVRGAIVLIEATDSNSQAAPFAGQA